MLGELLPHGRHVGWVVPSEEDMMDGLLPHGRHVGWVIPSEEDTMDGLLPMGDMLGGSFDHWRHVGLFPRGTHTDIFTVGKHREEKC